MTGRQTAISLGKVDWATVGIYLALVFIGWVNIYAAVYDESHPVIFDISQRYGMQLIWIAISIFMGIAILLIDDKYYHILAYPAYWIAIVVLVYVLFFGRVVNGARAWIVMGPVALQPAEVVKFTTSLAIARFMSQYTFSIRRLKDIAGALFLIGLPALIIVLQNDTGSAVVYAAFLIVMYREGLSGWVYVGLILAVVMFLASFLLTPFAILASLVAVFVVGEGLVNGRWKIKLIYLAAVAMGTIALYFGFNFFNEGSLSLYAALLVCVAVSLVFVVMYAYRERLRNVYILLALFMGSLAFTATVDYVFDNMMQVHQQKRILDLLGLEDDLVKWGYNVNQSKIAIGSGGFAGKGFLEGTQTKFNFVPEQSTDFIFSTLGEEWGFLGTSLVTALFLALILRLVKMAERQHEAFGRIYCYSVASLFFVHTVINIGMTIGLMPVIGIPLPFFSYGGSSMLAFTLLVFVAVKLDSKSTEGGPVYY